MNLKILHRKKMHALYNFHYIPFKSFHLKSRLCLLIVRKYNDRWLPNRAFIINYTLLQTVILFAFKMKCAACEKHFPFICRQCARLETSNEYFVYS